jgi:acyl-[acyl-carrier-protein]-phospholipid O-acyltransferase / long-chain-fatty-acid--[acyl-carrier-protein] ligase
MRGESFLRPIFKCIFKLIFRIEVRGEENIEAAGNRVLVICNHLSYLEPTIIGTFLPQAPSYAINIYQANKFKFLEKFFQLYKLDPSKPLSMKRLIQDLRPNDKNDIKRIVIFPEGRISTNGGIMKVYDGTGMIIEKTGATILPIRIDGTEYSRVSRLGAKLRLRWFPKVTVTFLPPIKCEKGTPVSSREIYDMMIYANYASKPAHRPILAGILDAYALHGPKHPVICDINRVDINYRQLFTRSFILSEKLRPLLTGQKNIGVLLPNSIGVVVTFVGLQMLGKIPCMLNFSAGKASVQHACHIATLGTVLTSRVFIEKGKLEHLIDGLKDKYNILYLEDLRPTITLVDKLTGLAKSFFAKAALQLVLENTKAEDPAVILYTSGSEGVPKGVALSHSNIMNNVAQFSAPIDLNTSDIIFNALPVFHSYGMTAGMVMPLLRGIKVFLYPTPLHYRIIPELMYDSDATIMFGTDTFFNGYAHYAHPYDFWNIRLAVAGAEKLRDTTRKLYSEKFRVNIFEGYGVTESGPVVSVNTPMEFKNGSVGRPLPAIECKLQPVEGLDRGGRLHIKGPNIMLGYIKEDKPGVIQPQGEWYDTGDIVEMDEDGFIYILGRAKRFAKIAGEMVSLMVSEDLAIGLLPDIAHASIAIPDERKGEQVILFSESKELTREALIARAKEAGTSELCLPKQIIYIDTIPRLGNGKIDYVSLAKLI